MSKQDVVDVLCTYFPDRIQVGCTVDELRDIADALGCDSELVLEAMEEALFWSDAEVSA